MSTPAPLGLRAGWPLYLGMAVAGAAAVLASASTLAALARAAGWAGWTPWLLPAALDVGGSAGGWCWLRPGAPAKAREFGRVVALVGAATTLVGNGLGHLIAAGYLDPGPLLVVVVGSVPAAVLVALAHLAALIGPAPAAPQRNADAVPALAAEPEADPDHAADAVLDTRRAVLALLTDRPVTVAELVRATGRSRTTIVGHLEALALKGVVHRDADKRYSTAHPRVLDTVEA